MTTNLGVLAARHAGRHELYRVAEARIEQNLAGAVSLLDQYYVNLIDDLDEATQTITRLRKLLDKMGAVLTDNL